MVLIIKIWFTVRDPCYTVNIYSGLIVGGKVQDLLIESVQLQRIDLVARLIAKAECDREDKELAVAWIAELTTRLIERLDEYDRIAECSQHA
nr:MAG TPA: hypothetical protein [Caudoviricetes sp.]